MVSEQQKFLEDMMTTKSKNNVWRAQQLLESNNYLESVVATSEKGGQRARQLPNAKMLKGYGDHWRVEKDAQRTWWFLDSKQFLEGLIAIAKQNYLEDMTTPRDKKCSKDAVALVIARQGNASWKKIIGKFSTTMNNETWQEKYKPK